MCQTPACLRTCFSLSLYLLLLGLTAPSAWAADRITMGREGQVFVDDHAIQSMDGLVRRINPLAKHPANPVLKPDRPWEENFTLPISCFHDEKLGLYRMWYRPVRDKFTLAYATSKDGITWDKPALGLYDFKGSRENNWLSVYTGPAWGGVIKDDRDKDPARRYKLLSYNRATKSNGLYLHISPDGLNWKPYSDKPLLEGLADCHNLLGWDAKVGRYVCYVRPDLPIRTVARTTSEDMVTWTPFETVLEPDDLDPPGTQFYGMSVFQDRGVYYGMLWVYHANQLTIDVQLTFSRDGIHWQRAAHRHPVLMFGLPDQWDSSLLIAMQPIRMGDEYKIFYLGYDRPHAVVYNNEAYPALTKPLPRDKQSWLAGRVGCGGLAICQRDRFVSLDAGPTEGVLVTKPFQLDGDELRLNADATRGQILVEILDEAGKPVPGFTAAHAIPLREDGVTLPISWDGDKGLSSLKGKTIQLRFLMKNAKLFSMEVAS